jgi:hypothetical protein
MAAKNPEILRLSVDDETKMFLETITGQLNDAMVDFVKRQDLKNGLQEAEAHLTRVIGESLAALIKSTEMLSGKVEASNRETRQSVQDVATRNSNAIVENGSAVITALNTLRQSVHNSDSDIRGVMLEITRLHESVSRLSDQSLRTESRIAEMTSQMEKLNRPWWHKLFG